jgi:hypothetical protein
MAQTKRGEFMGDFHDEEVRNIYARFETERALKREGIQQRKADCLDFLRAFSDIAINVILPVFIKSQPTTLPYGVSEIQTSPRYDHSDYKATFEILIGRINHRSLIFDADCEKMRVTIHHDIPDSPTIDRDVELKDITTDLVNREVVTFLQSALKVR